MSRENKIHLIMAYCTPCKREVELDENAIPKGGRPIGLRVRCSKCGQRGRVIMSPADHNPSSQMMGAGFYGHPKGRWRAKPD